MANWTNFLEDPGGYISGQNKEGFHGIGQFIRGDPDQAKAAYDQAIAQANQGGVDIKNFLLGQQQKALANYGPVQHMFSSMYGTGGIAPAQVPGAAGQQGAIGQAYGAR